MGLKSKPFWWIECDHVACDERCPPNGYEVVAWVDKDSARVCAEESDWERLPGEPETWVCPDHRIEYCDECGAHIGPLAGEQDYLCIHCAPAEPLT